MEIKDIHLLLIEDNSNFLEELIESLQDFEYHNIEKATNVKEAMEKLQYSGCHG